MKLNTNTHEVTGSGFAAVTDFSVEVNAKTFKVLSDTIYKDKIGSIVRELSCNAFDAHSVAGKSEVPFEIHLPDNFEPYFSIRDFGTGISPEDIKTVYTSYFTSTKDQSNDEVGAFGLGSKTPFSYTDAFTVISIHNGIKSMYNAHVSSGLPSIVAYGEPEATDEPDGLEITLGVETLDYKAFAEAVKRQLKFFPVKPTIINGSIDWSTIKPTLEIAGFTFYKIENCHRRYGYSRNEMSGLFLKQGPVGYPVDFDVIDQYMNSKGLKKSGFYNYIQNAANSYSSGVIIDMPIGTVEVTASREGISYSDVTIRNMLTKFEAISREVFKDVKAKLDAAYAESNATFAATVKGLDGYFLSSLNKETMEKNYPNFRFISTHGGGYNLFLKMDSKFTGTMVHRYDVSSFQKPKVVKRSKIDVSEDTGLPYFNITMLQENTTVYVKDIKTNFIGRIQDHCDATFCFVLELPSGVDSSDLEAAWGDGIEVINLSSLPAPQIKRVNTSGGHSITGGNNRVWFNIDSNLMTQAKWGFERGDTTLYRHNFTQQFGSTIEESVEENQDYVYFLTHTNKIIPSSNGLDNSHSSDEVMLFVQWLDKQGYKVVAIPNKDEAKALKTGQFISFESLWNDRQNNFHEDVWSMFGEWATKFYHNKIYRNFYSLYGWSARHQFEKVTAVLNAIGVDCNDIKNKVDEVMNEGCHAAPDLNNAIVSIVNRMSDHKDYNNRVKLMTQIKDCKDSYSNTVTLSDFESYMDQAGFKLPLRFSNIITEYAKMILENIDKIILYYVSESRDWDIRNVTIHDPLEADDVYFISHEDVLEATKQKLERGLTSP